MRHVMAGMLVVVCAQAASGAVIFQVPYEWYPFSLQPGAQFSVPITLTNTGITNPDAVAAGATSVWGLSFWLVGNEQTAGKIQLTGRTFNAPSGITDPTTANAAIPLPLTLQTTRNAKDLGSTGSTDPLPTGSTLYATLTFTVIEPPSLWWNIRIVQASYNDDLGNNWAFDPGSNFVIGIPEPASLALLGGGVCCLLGRRRRKVVA